MPVISGLKALVAWARHPDEHLAVCTVLGGGVPCARARGRETAVRFQERRLSELQRASLPVLGLATHPRLVLRGGLLTPALHSSSGCRGDVDAGCALHLRRVSWSLWPSSVTQPQPLLCAAAPRLPSSAPGGEQLGPYWPTPMQPLPQPSWPIGSGHSQECSFARPGKWLSGGGLTAAHTGTWNSDTSPKNGETGPLFLSTCGSWCRGGGRMGLGAESPHSPGRAKYCVFRGILWADT